MPITRKKLFLYGITSVAFLLSATGCRWMVKKPEYEGQELAKPLAIPADLNKPKTRDALTIPPKSMIGVNAPKAPSTRSLVVNGDVPTVWKKVGAALAGFSDVEVTAKAETIASYEVNFAGESFLLSVQANGAKSKIVAVGSDGSVSDSNAASVLIARFKPILGP
jgi:uncharacterized lipoprotein